MNESTEGSRHLVFNMWLKARIGDADVSSLRGVSNPLQALVLFILALSQPVLVNPSPRLVASHMVDWRNRGDQDFTDSAHRSLAGHVRALLEYSPSCLKTATRRQAVRHAASATPWFLLPSVAKAAQGAAELDLEFYLRGLVGAKTPQSQTLEAKPPRQLDPAFASAALAAVVDSLAKAVATSPTALKEAATKRRNSLSLEYDKVILGGAFGSGGYGSDIVADKGNVTQYGFDLTLLTLFNILADAKLTPDLLLVCTRELGARLLKVVGTPTTLGSDRRANLKASEIILGIRSCLDSLQLAGYVKSYTIDDSDVDDVLWAQRSELSETKVSITLVESASLGAAVVLNGRRDASPELARPLLLAYLAECGVSVNDVSETFLDGTYRSNPFEYRADQQILSFTLAPGTS